MKTRNTDSPANDRLQSKKLFELFVQHLSSEHHLTKEQINRYVARKGPPKEELLIPISIFSVRQLGAFESTVKFLHEAKRLSLSDIARLTNRDPRTIWHAYNSAKKKHPESLPSEPGDYNIPPEILSTRVLSVLESMVHYLNSNYGLSYSKIAKLLNRDPRTVFTVKNRAARKLKNA
jgi:hypothetical protein